MSFKRSRKDGRPNTVPLFKMTDPLPWCRHADEDSPSPRFAINIEGNLYFNPRAGYSQDIEDYV